MKVFKFLDIVKKARLSYKFLAGGPTGGNWPVCQTCGRTVDAAELKHEGTNSIEIWARCHGNEDFCRVEFPFKLDGSIEADGKTSWAIKRVMGDWMPFPTEHHEK